MVLKPIMAVFDLDVRYADRFASFANRLPRCPFQVVAFTNMEKLRESLKRQKIQILLAGDAEDGVGEFGTAAGGIACAGADFWDGEEWRTAGISQIIRLTAGAGNHIDQNYIYKYQSTERIIKSAMTMFADRETQEIELFTGIRCRITAVCSPVGRCGKTMFAMLLGRVLAEKERTLLLTLESLSGLGLLLEEVYESSLTDLLYYCRQGKLGKIRLDAALYSWGELDYVPPAAYPGDLADVSSQELVDLIEQIADCGGYEQIIVDTGVFGNYAAELLGICDRVLMPVLHDPVSEEKVRKFEQYLETRWGEEQTKKLEKLVLPASGGREQKPEELLWGEFGDFIRKMARGENGWS